MASQPSAQPTTELPRYGGFTRFELELEFVQCLANPFYINHLVADQKLLDDPGFIAYLDYLQYWKRPEYAKYLLYPGPTLKHLELLQQPDFRKAIVGGDWAGHLHAEGIKASLREKP